MMRFQAILLAAGLVTAQTPNFFFNLSIGIESGVFNQYGAGGWAIDFEQAHAITNSPPLGLGEATARMQYANWTAQTSGWATPWALTSLLWAPAFYVYGTWAPFGGLDISTDPADGLIVHAYDGPLADLGRVDLLDSSAASYATQGAIISVPDVPMRPYYWAFGGNPRMLGCNATINSVTITTGIEVNTTSP